MKVTTGTIIRTICLALALTNQVLTTIGKPVIPVTDEQVTEIITLAVTIGVSVYTYWKNNSWTAEAIKADEMMDSMKKAKKANEQF